MKALGGFIAAPLVFVAVLLMLIVGAGGGKSAASAAACGTASAPGVSAAGDLPAAVGRWSGDQIRMAATLLDAAAKLGVNQQAQTVLIMTAMGESSLSNPDHGDAVDNSTIGVLQQGESYGPRSARLNPAAAATAFLTRLVKVPDWESLEPTLAAHAVQGNADPYHYAPFWTDAQAVVAAVTGKQVSSGCAATGNGEQSAKTLIAARAAGTLTDYNPKMLDELNGMADGTASAQCQIDPRVLQILVLVLNKYGSVGVSDINRPCAGEGLHCEYSAHCTSPSTAVDFNSIGGRTTTGGDPASLELLAYLDTIMPKGSHAGQVQCRPAMTFQNITAFSDPCTHLHVDVRGTTAPLTATPGG